MVTENYISEPRVRVGMATKNISITEEAYARLKSLRQGKESFSDIINRVTNRRRLSEFAGFLSADSAKAIERHSKSLRQGLQRSATQRVRTIRQFVREDGMS